ncbi:phage portal protein [Nesterenkonia sp. CL21]|uniref:phage portal protein n=1 Tax=Nesterenkonia sp. CL21 TaxID=3064894 RepID=UPI00287B227B|nr:phage portal protein [Nesterenkonia sp. CL21]MDS2171618.1 phage portal protein [Nesterenkonia sp. CL21]
MQTISEQLEREGENPRNLDGTDGEKLLTRMEQMYRQITEDETHYDLMCDYWRGAHANPYAPSDQRAEIRALRKRAITNLIPLAVNIPAQLSFADGFRRNEEDFPEEWQVWENSGFKSRQTSAFTSSLVYGGAYISVENLGTGEPRLCLLSSRNTVAFYHDPVNDIHPAFAMTIKHYPRFQEPGLAVYYDAEKTVHWDMDETGEFSNPREYPHGLGKTPMRRLPCMVDDEGVSRGVVEMLIPAQDRINQTSFDLLATQSFSAFKVRWASGMMGDPILDENGEPKVDADGNQMYRPVPIDQSTFLQTDDPQARFGTMDETPLDGFLEARENDIRSFAVQGQLPPHSLLGNMSNLSAETLVAAMSQTQRFAHVLKTAWGQAIVDLMHLVAIDLGVVGPDEEYEAEVRWRDMEEHTLGAQVDALAKGAESLQIPVRGLWSRFPGTTAGEIARWERLREEEYEAGFDVPDSVDDVNMREAVEPPTGDGIDLGEDE